MVNDVSFFKFSDNIFIEFSCIKKTDLRYGNATLNYIILPSKISLSLSSQINKDGYSPTYYLTMIGGAFVGKSNAIEVSYGCCENGSVKKGLSSFLNLSDNDTLLKYYTNSIKYNDKSNFVNNYYPFKYENKGYLYLFNVCIVKGNFCYCKDWSPFEGLSYKTYHDSICVIRSLKEVRDLTPREVLQLDKFFRVLIMNVKVKNL